MGNPVLDRLLAEREQQTEFIAHLLEKVEEEKRDLVDAERSNVEAARQRITALDEQIEPLEEWEVTRNAHQGSAVRPTNPAQKKNAERATLGGVSDRGQKYPTAGHFLVDLMAARGFSGDRRDVDPDPAALERVQSALGRQVDVEERAVAKQITGDTPGLLPENIVGEVLTDLDAARPLIQSVGAKPLASVKGKTFSRPRITQHTTVGKQTAEKSELPSRKMLVDSVDFTKETYGGALNVSRQDIDWTDPSAWNALIQDLQLVYGAETEDATSVKFADAVTQTVTVPSAQAGDLKAWITALYEAAVQAATADGSKRASALRLPNTIWTSVDMWGSLGSLLSSERTLLQSSGKATATAFDGDLLDIQRVMAPGLPEGTMIVGRSNLFEFHEERIGLLQAVEPAILGVEIAYGGYVASGMIDPTAFSKIVVATA